MGGAVAASTVGIMATCFVRIYWDQQHLEDVSLEGDTYVIGRGHGSQILLDDAAVSRQHAVIRRYGDGYVLEDLGSPNRTLVNDNPVNHRALFHGDRIRIGRHTLLYQAGLASPLLPAPEESEGMRIAWSSQEATAFVNLADILPKDPERQVAMPTLEMLDVPGGVRLPITREAVLFGRGEGADVEVRSFNPFVQDFAILTRRGDTCQLSRLSGWISVRVNGKRCGMQILEDGDRFSVGRSRFAIRIPAKPRTATPAKGHSWTRTR